ncbi:conserved hypothetical protein [Gloeothece citriformis PCC 7424]|uniref:DUF7660 domain-containing protein n=1 Tax=Gloeothece citriformis (strain PCC 7424) TaxID=65393 RepID=B7K8F1_GLOC7|nr:hypothetical protein [Gloeothece citriformis]ACK69911.1 conserved hypothetical protein [Gloeothece citriformis PCC 7424]
MELDELLNRVNSRDTFLEFVAALRADLVASNAQETVAPSSPYVPNACDWENPSLERYLQALHTWIEDMGDRISEPPSWRTFADILYAAKIYE